MADSGTPVSLQAGSAIFNCRGLIGVHPEIDVGKQVVPGFDRRQPVGIDASDSILRGVGADGEVSALCATGYFMGIRDGGGVGSRLFRVMRYFQDFSDVGFPISTC